MVLVCGIPMKMLEDLMWESHIQTNIQYWLTSKNINFNMAKGGDSNFAIQRSLHRRVLKKVAMSGIRLLIPTTTQ